MKKIFILMVLLCPLFLSCSNDLKNKNVIADGFVTEEESKIMQELWCDYNKGRPFAKAQCEDYWED